MKKNLVFLLILLVIGGGAYFFFFGGKELPLFSSLNNRGTIEGAPAVIQAKRGDVTRKLLETGVVYALGQVNIKSKTGGKIINTTVQEGDYVTQGTILVRLDDQGARTRLNQAKANLQRSEAEIGQARIRLEHSHANLESSRKLFDKGLVAEYELDQAKRDYALAKIQLSQTHSNKQYHQESYAAALSDLENTTIKAPMSGVVIRKLVEEGELVAPVSQVLLVMGDLSGMEIRSDINELDINKIKKGQPVEIRFDAIAEVSYEGKVSKIAPVGMSRGNIVTYGVGIKILNPDGRVKPDMSCDIDLVLERAENVIYLPIDAVKKEEGKSFVLIKKGEKFSRKEVILGIADGQYVEIKEGVKEGEEVRPFPSEKGREEVETRRRGRSAKDFE